MISPPVSRHARSRGGKRNPGAAVFLWLLLVLAPGALHAQKTDVITVRNGDQMTGEMKSMDRGLLVFSTDVARTIDVEWPKVVTARTDKRFTITLADGSILYGSLQPGTADSVVIVADSVSLTVATQAVVSLARLKPTFWKALDGKIGLGFDFTQQNAKTDFTLSGNVKYVRLSNVTKLDFSSTFSRQDDTDDIDRDNLTLANFRQFKKRWFFLGFGSASRNSQLSLDFRGTVGGGFGRLLAQSNKVDVAVWVAPAVSLEEYTGEPGNTSIPLLIAADFLWFTWGALDTQISSQLAVIPILNQGGRWRLNFTLSLEREIVKNFYIELGITELYDSRPPSIDANQNDFSLTTSLGWKF